jgi:hypothetical protein
MKVLPLARGLAVLCLPFFLLFLSSCSGGRAASGEGARGGTLHTAFPGTPLSGEAQAAMEEAKSGDPEKIRALLPYFATRR